MEDVHALQGMAGNIIHAIATTNAIVGGLIVVEAMKILAGKPESSKVGCATSAAAMKTFCDAPALPRSVPELYVAKGNSICCSQCGLSCRLLLS